MFIANGLSDIGLQTTTITYISVTFNSYWEPWKFNLLGFISRIIR